MPTWPTPCCPTKCCRVSRAPRLAPAPPPPPPPAWCLAEPVSPQRRCPAPSARPSTSWASCAACWSTSSGACGCSTWSRRARPPSSAAWPSACASSASPSGVPPHPHPRAGRGGSRRGWGVGARGLMSPVSVAMIRELTSGSVMEDCMRGWGGETPGPSPVLKGVLTPDHGGSGPGEGLLMRASGVGAGRKCCGPPTPCFLRPVPLIAPGQEPAPRCSLGAGR